VPEVDELEQGDGQEVAVENARRKARAVAQGAPVGVVLGVDTVVCAGGRLYGKPADESQARSTLQALSGAEHVVLSGVCLVEDGAERTALASTSVSFRDLSEELLDWYLASGEWRERAGGYAIQGRGAALVTAIQGDFWNVVGLPVAKLLELAPGLLLS
jgi:septum formation protein